MPMNGLKQMNEIKSRIHEKYGDSIRIVSIEKDWKVSESDYTCYDIYAQTAYGYNTFEIDQNTLKNNYTSLHWMQWMEKEATRIGDVHFSDNFHVHVNLVGGWTDTIPGVDHIIPYKEFMQTYCDNSRGRIPDNMIRFNFSSNHSNSNYQGFLEEIAKSELIFDTLLLIYKDNYRVKFTYNDVQVLAENYDESVVESLTYKFEP